MPQIKHIASGTIYTVNQTPMLVNGIWECGDQRFTDVSGDQYEPMPDAAQYPILTPPEFRMLYTSQERIVLKANVASATPDPVLKDFFDELYDPQLKQVDLNLSSIRGAITYSLNFVAPHMTPPYTADDIVRREAEMLAGTPQ